MATGRPILGFKNRLLIIFFVLMLLPLLAVGALSYHYYHREAWDSTTAAADYAMRELTREIDSIFSDAEKLLAIGSYTVAERYLSNRGDAYVNAKEILDLMRLYRGRHRPGSDIRNIYLVGIDGRGISEREGVFRLRHAFAAVPALRRLGGSSADAAVVEFDRGELSGYWDKPSWQQPLPDNDGPALGLGRRITDPIRKELLGAAIIEVDPERIARIIAAQSSPGGMSISSAARTGKTLFGDPAREASPEWASAWRNIAGEKSGRFVHRLAGRDMVLVHNLSKSTGWRLVGAVPLDVMMARAYRIRAITAVSVLGCIVFTMLLYALISARLTKPLQTLQGKMRLAARGDMDVRFHSPVRDEIAALGDSFNRMIERIDQLMRQARREQDKLKKAEFRALQAQINPHFLYNTLDSIIWLSQASRHEELMEMVVALSKFFRLTLNGGRELVTVGEELDHAANYLIIQRMRYHDILDYEFDVDPRVKRFQMIKLLLQPLIENAIYHGLKNKRGGGKIWVEGDYDKATGAVAFMIRDNGKGMGPERLAEVRRDMRGDGADPDDGGHALRNVHERLRLYYGAGHGLSLDSTEDEGTVVTMLFPAVEASYV